MAPKLQATKRPTTSMADSFDPTQFTSWVQTYDSRQAALADLGSGVRCKGHCARAVKKAGSVTFLRCRLQTSTPPCTWSAMLREGPDGSVDLCQHPSQWRLHNDQSVQVGTRGLVDLEQHKALDKLLKSSATAKPSTALRAARLDDKAGDTQLRQVQTLKRTIAQGFMSCRSAGELRAIIARHTSMPPKMTQGYFCYSYVSPPAQKKLKVTLVATTRALQKRWVDSPHCQAAADGGFKFNLLGWPLHVLGCVNPAGNFGLCALALTSTMAKEHIADMLRGFRDSTIRATGCGASGANKVLAMSDAEAAYREGLRTVFASANLMCYFHVKQAAKKNLDKRLPETEEVKDEKFKAISADIDVARGALCHSDFHTRMEAVRAAWEADGLPARTAWKDKCGREYNFVSSFFEQWGEKVTEWYVGAAGDSSAPGTNNGAESCVKYTRADAGNVVASIGETLRFVLEQVKHTSMKAFNPAAARPTEDKLWLRAMAFSSLFNTDKVKPSGHDGWKLYCCNAREDEDSEDVSLRKPISTTRAETMARAFVALQKGGSATLASIRRFTGPNGVRVFGIRGGDPFCTCPSFSPFHRCFHTIGLSLFLGKVKAPETLDTTLLSSASRPGAKRKAPPRGAVPLMVDQKDVRIAQLEAQLCKLKRSRAPVTEEALASKRRNVGVAPEAPPQQEGSWVSRARCRAKTSQRQAALAGIAVKSEPRDLDVPLTPQSPGEATANSSDVSPGPQSEGAASPAGVSASSLSEGDVDAEDACEEAAYAPEPPLELHVRLTYAVNAKGSMVVTSNDPVNIIEVMHASRTLREELCVLTAALGAPDELLDGYVAYSLLMDDGAQTFGLRKLDLDATVADACHTSKHILLCRKGG